LTAHTPAEVDDFVRRHNGHANLYYTVNPTRTALTKKAAKTDVAAIEYPLADLDPNDDETPDEAKARYMRQLERFEPKPTFIIDSGNGLQLLWKLSASIALGKPKMIEGKLAFSAEDQAKIDDVEARTKNIMERLGSKAGTQNIDRILRLPGTINLPNARKLKAGRAPCQAKLVSFNDAVHSFEAFPLPAHGGGKSHRSTRRDRASSSAKAMPQALRHMLHLTGDRPADYESRSALLWVFLKKGLHTGIDEEVIIDACLDDKYRGCSIREHVRDNGDSRAYLQRQIERALNDEETKSSDGKITIRIKPGETHLAWRETQDVLVARSCPVFVRGGKLVRPMWRFEKSHEQNRKILTAHIMRLNFERLSALDALTTSSCQRRVPPIARAHRWSDLPWDEDALANRMR
jgi:hypothetical protein